MTNANLDAVKRLTSTFEYADGTAELSASDVALIMDYITDVAFVGDGYEVHNNIVEIDKAVNGPIKAALLELYTKVCG